MAKKKFSRLSILLEARDKMSGPLTQAANASKTLQNRVSQLSNGLNRSRNSVVNANNANRLLADGYRELGRRISVADEKVKISTRLFRALPAPIKLAAYTLEGYSKALYRMVTANVIARTSTKMFKLAMAGALNTTDYFANAVKRAASAMYVLSGAQKVVKGIALPFKYAGMQAQKFGYHVKAAVKNSFLYQAFSVILKDIANDFGRIHSKNKTFLSNIPRMVKMTKAWHAYRYAIDGAKMSLNKAQIAFTIFKNSNRTIENMTNKWKSMTGAVSGLVSKMTGLFNIFKRTNNEMSRTGSTGRSTFNQLAAANARLNAETAKLNRELSRANSKLSSMKGNLGSIKGMGNVFAGLYVGQMAGHVGGQVTESTIGKAMEQDYSSKSVGILAGDQVKGDAFYKQIQDYAASTIYSPEDWSRGLRSAIGKSKSIEDLEKFQLATEQLATLDPIQGIDGAALAIRELNSGDSKSLVERFELPRGAINDIKNMKDPVEQMVKLMEIVGRETGFTVEAIQKMKELPLMQYQKMVNMFKTFLGYVGAPAMKTLAPIIERVNKAMSDGKFKPAIEALGKALDNTVHKIIDFSTSLYNSISSGKLQAKWQPVIDLFGNIKNSISEAWPTISAIFDNARIIIGKVADDINAEWPTANGFLQGALDLVKDISDWVVNNWSGVAPVIYGVVTAMTALKVVTGIAAGWTALTGAVTLFAGSMTLATGATTGLTAAMWANPIGLIIGLVAGLIVGIATLYNKSETFRGWCDRFTTWVFTMGIKAFVWLRNAVADVKDAFVGVADWVSNAYDKFKNFIELAKNFKMPSFGMPKFLGGEGLIQPNGSHHGGLNNVPYDGYTARLHKGERILTAQENKSGTGAIQAMVTGNTFVVREEADIEKITDSLVAKLLATRETM